MKIPMKIPSRFHGNVGEPRLVFGSRFYFRGTTSFNSVNRLQQQNCSKRCLLHVIWLTLLYCAVMYLILLYFARTHTLYCVIFHFQLHSLISFTLLHPLHRLIKASWDVSFFFFLVVVRLSELYMRV